MDIIYVIYRNGELYKEFGRKSAYLEERYAKQVITTDSKKLAWLHCDEDWYELNNEESDKLIQEEKDKFEIVEFTRR